MTESRGANSSHRFPAAILILGAMVIMALLAMPGAALAEGPAATNGASEVCAPCHSSEMTAWQASTHAKSSVGCETCHGPMNADHPTKKGSMKLEVESQGCKACHSATYDQWKSSPHAGSGVQCIGCHLSHSQKARLTDDTLCGSCHRSVMTEAAHGAHSAAKIGCVACHASSPDGKSAPSHTFTVVADNCVDCHGQSIHEFVVATTASQKPNVEQSLSARVKELEAANSSMVPLMAINLGLGLGVGALGGVVLMLVIFYVRERRVRR